MSTGRHVSTQPNVLWIVADQLRADHVGFGGNTVVRTPNLDALAARATVFDRAYVANPICMPNRCSMITGRMPSAHGVIFNDRSLPWTAGTVLRQLVAAGYGTTLIGKSHLQHGLSRNVARAGSMAPTLRSETPAGWDTLENTERYLHDEPDIQDFYGFQHVEFAIGHGDAVTGHHYRWALQRGADPASLNPDWQVPGPALDRYAGWWQVYKPTLPEELHSTTFVTERTIASLERHAATGQPFFLQCSYPDPHHPFTPPGKWWHAYQPEDMPEPVTFDDPLTHAPRHLSLIRRWTPSRNIVQMFGPTRELVRHAMAAEFGMIAMMDEGIGRVLGALQSLDLADNTVVVFTSDHGDMFGDHGLMLKATMHYQGCLRVPLCIARPGQTGVRTQALASSLDLAQTFLDLAGAQPFADMQGTSLVPLLDDPGAAVRDYCLVEEDFPLALAGSPLPLRTRTLYAGNHRYTRYSTGEVELYNLQSDPHELQNLAASGSHAALCGEFADRLSGALMDAASMAIVG
ncbi:MAG: sulfatase-like hydrolase/transferase [Pseudomonadales bacterium]